jgi:hypothetical protein
MKRHFNTFRAVEFQTGTTNTGSLKEVMQLKRKHKVDGLQLADCCRSRLS